MTILLQGLSFDPSAYFTRENPQVSLSGGMNPSDVCLAADLICYEKEARGIIPMPPIVTIHRTSAPKN
jgi:hypothetical protein